MLADNLIFAASDWNPPSFHSTMGFPSSSDCYGVHCRCGNITCIAQDGDLYCQTNDLEDKDGDLGGVLGGMLCFALGPHKIMYVHARMLRVYSGVYTGQLHHEPWQELLRSILVMRSSRMISIYSSLLTQSRSEDSGGFLQLQPLSENLLTT